MLGRAGLHFVQNAGNGVDVGVRNICEIVTNRKSVGYDSR